MAIKHILTDLNLHKNSLINAVIGSFADAGKAGAIKYNTTDNVLQYHNGTDWVTLTQDTWRAIKVDGQQILNNSITGNALDLKGTSNQITLTNVSGAVTFALHQDILDGITKANSAIQGIKLSGETSTLTPDANKIVTLPLAATSTKGIIAGISQYDGTITNGVIDITTNTATSSTNKIATMTDVNTVANTKNVTFGSDAASANTVAIKVKQNGTAVSNTVTLTGENTSTNYGVTITGAANTPTFGLTSATTTALGKAVTALQAADIDGTFSASTKASHTPSGAADDYAETYTLNKLTVTDNVWATTSENTLYVKTAQNAGNPLVTASDIAELSGAMHYGGSIASNNNWPANADVKQGDTWVATATFTHGTTTIEQGDMIVFGTTGDNTDFAIVQTNMTIGVASGQVAPNDGALVNGNLVDATSTGIHDTGITTASVLTGVTSVSTSSTSNDGVVVKIVQDGHNVKYTYRDVTTSDSAVSGKYVSAVSQDKNGKITVSRQDLPNTNVTSDLVVAATNSATSNTTATTTPVANGSVHMNHVEGSAVSNSHLIQGGSGISVTATKSSTSGTSTEILVTHTNSITAGTASGSSGSVNFGGTITLPSVTYDAQGHITAKGTTTVTLPANPNTDTTSLKVGSTTITANHLASPSENITFAGDTWVTPAADASTKTITYTHKSGTAPTQTSTTSGTADDWSESVTINTPQLTVDAAGHVTAIGNAATTITIPANPNTDNTKLVSGGTSSATTGITKNTSSVSASSTNGVTIEAGNKWIETGVTNSKFQIGHIVTTNGAKSNVGTSYSVGGSPTESPYAVNWGDSLVITTPTLTWDEAGHMTANGTTTQTIVMPANPAAGATHKISADNPASTSSTLQNGEFTWAIDISSLGLAQGDTDYLVTVRAKTADTTLGILANEEVICQVIHTDYQTVTIKINVPDGTTSVAAGKYRATIIG